MKIGLLTGSKKTDEKNQKQVNKKKYAKTVQDTIAYEAAYVNGIFRVGYNLYSKTYSLTDINFRTADDENQEALFARFVELLNALSEAQIQFTCVNRTIDKDKFEEDFCLKYKSDGLNEYRDEANNIMLSHLEDNGSVSSSKYITLTINANDIDDAAQQFSRLDGTVINSINAVGGSVAVPLNLEERLRVLYDILNDNEDSAFVYDLNAMMSQKITTKDIIAPDSMLIMKDYINVGDRFACTLFLDTYPSLLTTEFMADLNEMPFNFVSSVHLSGISQEKSMKIISRQITNINAQIQTTQRKLRSKGASYDTMSPDLRNAKEEAERLREDLTSKNQKLYFATVVMTVFANDKEEMQKFIKYVQTVGQKHMCNIRKLSYQQDNGFSAVLPLGYNNLSVKRMLTTDSAALFMPFSSEEITQKGGIYYGLNAISNSMVIYNRLTARNASGVYLGTAGSGKSFAAKREIVSVLLGTDADVYVIDPENEYTPLAKALGGEIVRLAAGSDNHINPFDMDIQYAEDTSGQGDPIAMKADFIRSICETALGGKYGLLPTQKSVIDRCVRELYAPYMEYISAHPEETLNYDKAPTLLDFHELLLAQDQVEAHNMALALEIYCKGSLGLFAHKTNVDTHSRFIVYDIKDIGTGLYELGLKVCLNDIWNRTIANKSKKKRTWFYLDEFYLLTKTESSSEFLQQIFKRARKWGGVPTGITQDVEDLLSSRESRAVLNNCDFVMMFNQSSLGATQLSELYNLSPAQQRHIKNVPSGHGLMFTGKTVIPIEDKYPTDTKTFELLQTTLKKEKTDE